MWGSPQTFSLGRKISNFFRELFFGGWGRGGVTFCTFLQQNKLFPTGLKCRSRQKNYDIQTVNCELTNLNFLCMSVFQSIPTAFNPAAPAKTRNLPKVGDPVRINYCLAQYINFLVLPPNVLENINTVLTSVILSGPLYCLVLFLFCSL